MFFSFGIMYANIRDYVSNNFMEDKDIKIINISECENKSLNSTTNCLRDWMEQFYNYTIREDTIKTLDDIKQNGGDCYDYSHLYESAARELRFNSSVITIHVDENTSHAIALIYDETGYCMVDQIIQPRCVYYSNRSKND